MAPNSAGSSAGGSGAAAHRKTFYAHGHTPHTARACALAWRRYLMRTLQAGFSMACSRARRAASRVVVAERRARRCARRWRRANAFLCLVAS